MIRQLGIPLSAVFAGVFFAAARADDMSRADAKPAPVQPDAAADDEEFTPLFNGKDLTGWEGATDGYAVEDGVLVCVKGKGGNLYTEKQYANFILRFDFMLDNGGNNGVGIRCE